MDCKKYPCKDWLVQQHCSTNTGERTINTLLFHKTEDPFRGILHVVLGPPPRAPRPLAPHTARARSHRTRPRWARHVPGAVEGEVTLSLRTPSIRLIRNMIALTIAYQRGMGRRSHTTIQNLLYPSVSSWPPLAFGRIGPPPNAHLATESRYKMSV